MVLRGELKGRYKRSSGDTTTIPTWSTQRQEEISSKISYGLQKQRKTAQIFL